MKHYVYRITNIRLNKHYYGTRTSKKTIPEKDIGYIYFSSSSDKDFIKDQKENPQDYKYKVIKKFNTRKEAIELEIKLHNKFNVGVNESFYNRSKQTSTGFDRKGVEPWNKNIKNPYTSETIKNMKKTKKNNPYKPSDEMKKYLSTINTGKLNGFYSKKHTKKTKEKWNRKGTQRGSKNHNSKIINIFNSSGELKFVCEGNFIEVCKNNKLPAKLAYSYKNNGTPIYTNVPNATKSLLINKDLYKFKGWYALIIN